MSTPRPFKVLGIQQIAIGGPDKTRLQKLWVDMFGLEVTGTFKSERENVDEDICAMGTGPFKVEVDLMQPLDPEKKPAVHTTPLNHVGLWIDKLPEAVEWLTANGVRFAPGGIRKGAAGFDICFLHPKGNDEFPIGGEGVLVSWCRHPPRWSARSRSSPQPEAGPACRARAFASAASMIARLRSISAWAPGPSSTLVWA